MAAFFISHTPLRVAGLLFRINHLKVQFLELLGIGRAGRAHQKVPPLLGEREHGHFADILLARQQHHHPFQADRQAAYFEAVELAGFTPAEARKFFGEPSLAAFDLDRFEVLIRPWPTREAHDRFVAAFERFSS